LQMAVSEQNNIDKPPFYFNLDTCSDAVQQIQERLTDYVDY
jgi:hypothetical protein